MSKPKPVAPRPNIKREKLVRVLVRVWEIYEKKNGQPVMSMFLPESQFWVFRDRPIYKPKKKARVK